MLSYRPHPLRFLLLIPTEKYPKYDGVDAASHTTKDSTSLFEVVTAQFATIENMNGTIDPIAIIGFAFKFPQDVTSEDSLWNLLLERRSTRTDVPMNRWNLDGFYKPYGNRPGTVRILPLRF